MSRERRKNNSLGEFVTGCPGGDPIEVESVVSIDGVESLDSEDKGYSSGLSEDEGSDHVQSGLSVSREMPKITPFTFQISQQDSVTQLPKGYEKRGSELHKELGYKNNPVMRSAKGLHCAWMILKSPSTKQVAPAVILQHTKLRYALTSILGDGQVSPRKDQCEQSTVGQSPVSGQKKRKSRLKPIATDVRNQLQRDWGLLGRLKGKHKYPQIEILRAKWRRMGISERAVARVNNVSQTNLRWYLRDTRKESFKRVTKDQKARVLSFFSRDDISQVLPTKRYAKLRFLRHTFAELYSRYVQFEAQHKRRAVSLTSVHRILPKKTFKKVGKTPFQNCACSRCTNVGYLVAAGKTKGLRGLPTNLGKLARLACCHDPEREAVDCHEIYKCPRDCRARVCKKCPDAFATYIRENNPDLDMNTPVTYRQWGYKVRITKTGQEKRDYKLHTYESDMNEVVNKLKLEMRELPQHIYWYVWQGEQYDKLMQCLEPGEAVFLADFAKNMQIVRQGEIQNAFFHRNSVTLHPVIIFAKCPQGCGELFVDELMCISPDLMHDSLAAHRYLREGIKHLQQYNISLQKAYIFSDNCTSQFKCYKVFQLMSKLEKRFKITIECHYFGAGHGKSRADGWTGRFKMWTEKAIRAKEACLNDAFDLYTWAKRKLTTKVNIANSPDMCTHYQRSVVLVTNINRNFQDTWRTLPGTLKVHSLKFVGPGVVLIRESSCFCRYISEYPCYLFHSARIILPK